MGVSKSDRVASAGEETYLKYVHKSNSLRDQNQAREVVGEVQNPLADGRRKLLALLGLGGQVFEDPERGVDVHVGCVSDRDSAGRRGSLDNLTVGNAGTG